MRKSARIEIGKKRLVNILQMQTVSCDRTLEQQIADAGPNPMRVEPTILTEARRILEKDKVILSRKKNRKTSGSCNLLIRTINRATRRKAPFDFRRAGKVASRSDDVREGE